VNTSKPNTFLPLEQKSKKESRVERYTWNKGRFNFLLRRTEEVYGRKKNLALRAVIENQIAQTLPRISDAHLLELYKFAYSKYLTKCHRDYRHHSGFLRTRAEHAFLDTLESILKQHPEFKYLEIYPSNDFSKNLNPGMKMVVGNYVPDFLIFGLKTDGYTSLTIEIDGDSHIHKFAKDELRRSHLAELKIRQLSISNERAANAADILALLEKTYRKRSGALDEQIKRNKRLIWTKTIACQLTLKEIDEFALDNWGIPLNLRLEAEYILRLQDVPRKIKKELMAVHSNTCK
jgi:very-short-patch-repair endonuclease